jgi:hypothetical protein
MNSITIEFYAKNKKCHCRNPISVVVPDTKEYKHMEGYSGGVMVCTGKYYTGCRICKCRLGQ